jgi:UDP-glucose 4-epimerase
LDTVARVHGQLFAIQEMPRRAGDPPELIADAQRIRTTLKWQPQHDDLEKIVASSLHWEKKLQHLRFE